MSNGPYYYNVQEGYCGSKEDYYDSKGHDPYNMWIEKLENLKIISKNNIVNKKNYKHFVGKIILNGIAHNKYLWGGIENPIKSKVNLLIDNEIITNFTKGKIIVETWVNTNFIKLGKKEEQVISTDFTHSNNVNRCNLKYSNNLNNKPKEGVNPSIEIVSAQSTLSRELNGKYIIPPGGSYLLLIEPTSLEKEINLSFSWWEEEL
ncbi:DUF6143 family protein [Clostridium tarantellae]|uniref:Uncharacterized protein n=1 Tax=Clostridium tarantellae TaxID=39493 RepID=A0A6I1MLG5_9CLOT|nr:DUF6143 family protein [Clostridium tarantellae]MPQ43583.1 hypothetical protein [Clostridium tarantellae]